MGSILGMLILGSYYIRGCSHRTESVLVLGECIIGVFKGNVYISKFYYKGVSILGGLYYRATLLYGLSKIIGVYNRDVYYRSVYIGGTYYMGCILSPVN